MHARTNLPLALTLIAALSIIALAAIGAQKIGPASAGAPLLVTKSADTNDGTCDADCSLREAIIAANANPGADTITLPADTYTFTIAGAGEDLAATGDLDITDDLTINGAGMASTMIDAAQLDRVFDVDPAGSGVTVVIAGVTIKGGDPGDSAGGIQNKGNLTLESVTVTGNETNAFNRSGGGILNHGSGVLIVNDSTISDNHANGGGGGNTGGGIQNANAADITINKTIIIKNSAYSGGGFHNGNIATATINNGTVKGNEALGEQGGGISVTQGTEMTINNTSIIGNLAVTNGGGVYSTQSAVVTINNSSLVENHAVDGGGLDQDPMANAEPVSTIINSTITDNSAEEDGGGIGRRGGGVINLNNVTITGNAADSDSSGTGDGGGISNEAGGAVNFKNTIIAGNFDFTSEPDCFGTLTSEGYNLIEDVSAGCTIAGNTTGNVTGADPLLMPGADNGGSTITHAIPAGSPAVDAGNPANPGSGGDACEAADQRGVSRPLDGDSDSTALCDIGAYEAPGDPPTATPVPTATPAPTPSPTSTPTSTPTGTPPAGQSVTWADNNCKDDVNPIDSLFVLRADAGLPTDTGDCPDMGATIEVLNASPHVWGDVDCKDGMTPVDSLKILRFDAGLSVSQEEGCPAMGASVTIVAT